MRKKRFALNTSTSLLYQITTLACGFILPRLLLLYYGSEVNGLVNSITQFLSIISFLDMGVGAVVQSSLYKPLAENNNREISAIVVSADNFFRRIAEILLAYITILIIFYPRLISSNYSFIYIATLIVAMGINSFAQYYFGVVNRLLLTADQHGYIQYNACTITLILNTFVCAILIKMNCGIQIVKFTTSLIYLARPIVLHYYVKKNYDIDRKQKLSSEPIKQKWNGLAQHIAAVVLDGTDTIVLTIFSTLANVSIYSVYHLVVYGVKQIFTSLTSGIQALMGDMWAKQELDKLNDFFGWVEWSIHTGTVLIFSCVGLLIVPFVSVYTFGVNDVQYSQPLFAALLVLANAAHCLRMPYNLMILAGGHYKQTQKNYVVAAVLNLTSSIVLVRLFGLIGVAFGTLIAMLYQTVWMGIYDSKNLIKWPIKNFVKQLLVDIFTTAIIIVAYWVFSPWFIMKSVTYLSWIFLAVRVSVLVAFITVGVNFLFYNKRILSMLRKMKFDRKE